MITALAPMLRRTIGEHINLRHRPPGTGGGLPVLIDRCHLEQVVVNLAANARDAMPGGGRLPIEWDRVLPDRAELGPTCARSARPPAVPTGRSAPNSSAFRSPIAGTAWTRVAQTAPSSPSSPPSHVGHGTGLGLAGVYGIVRDAGGVATAVLRSLGHGTTVKIYLPLATTTPPTSRWPLGRAPAR